EYENFNAAAATVKINGKNIHPGSAKEKMKNSILIAMEFQSLLPTFERPEFTEKYEGFSHLNEISGNVEMTKLHYILRDHDSEKLEKKKQNFLDIADYLNRKYGADTIVLDIRDSYRNMKEILLDHMYIVEKAKDAMIKSGVTPHVDPIRGGTDGAQLSFMGLPCPNIFTGGENMHGRFEFIPVQSLEKCLLPAEILTGQTVFYMPKH
ncbi:MAG: tripeptide aminopeptidase PepT, partial [Elusimicrobia bacterium]|nr:tripeptide aminopeptidase PepT [Elusimicrobiota bacterium]